MTEARVLREGTLRWVQGSGSGNVWATASAPTSGLLAYVESMTYTSAETFVAITERGTPDHFKKTMAAVINGTVNMNWTGQFPNAVSGSGASVPFFHWEHRASAGELGPNSAVYTQLLGVVIPSQAWNEAEAANMLNVTWNALAMNGPTASGYLS
jgi:hypothetical protein